MLSEAEIRSLVHRDVEAPGRRPSWGESAMVSAIESKLNREGSYRDLAARYGVPKTTLHVYVDRAMNATDWSRSTPDSSGSSGSVRGNSEQFRPPVPNNSGQSSLSIGGTASHGIRDSSERFRAGLFSHRKTLVAGGVVGGGFLVWQIGKRRGWWARLAARWGQAQQPIVEPLNEQVVLESIRARLNQEAENSHDEQFDGLKIV